MSLETECADAEIHCVRCGKRAEMEPVEPGQPLFSKPWRLRHWLAAPNAKVPEVRDICHACFMSFQGDEEALLEFMKRTPTPPIWLRWQQEQLALH